MFVILFLLFQYFRHFSVISFPKSNLFPTFDEILCSESFALNIVTPLTPSSGPKVKVTLNIYKNKWKHMKPFNKPISFSLFCKPACMFLLQKSQQSNCHCTCTCILCCMHVLTQMLPTCHTHVISAIFCFLNPSHV